MIKVTNFGKKYDKYIFKNVDISFDKFGVHYFCGKNGIGKSTFFRCVSHLEDYEGRIENFSKKIFYVFDNTPFYSNLKVIDNIKIITDIYDNALILSIASQYIDEEILFRKVNKCSFGEKKMIYLIILELLDADIIILDEFNNGLDKKNLIKLKKFLEKYKSQKIIFLSSHDYDFLENADYVYVLENYNIKKISKTEFNSIKISGGKEHD